MSSQKYILLVEEIRATLSAVPLVGKVWAGMRDIRTQTDDETFKTMCVDATQGCVAVWFIQRESFEEKLAGHGRDRRYSTYVMRGFYARNDARNTEAIFQNIIDDISAAFTPHSKLNGKVLFIDPVQARTIAFAELDGGNYGHILCHYAELSLSVVEHFTIAES